MGRVWGPDPVPAARRAPQYGVVIPDERGDAQPALPQRAPMAELHTTRMAAVVPAAAREAYRAEVGPAPLFVPLEIAVSLEQNEPAAGPGSGWFDLPLPLDAPAPLPAVPRAVELAEAAATLRRWQGECDVADWLDGWATAGARG